MIIDIKDKITNNLDIKGIADLYKLKGLQEGGLLKINYSQIARELSIDRRTVKKHINGFKKSPTRKKKDCISDFKEIIEELLESKQIFSYKRILWEYLRDNHNFKGGYINFCHCIKKYKDIDNYFRLHSGKALKGVTPRFETLAGKQAQIDWKEKIIFELSTGERIIINVFVFILSYSRFRTYQISLTKNQEILFTFLDNAFEIIGGVPEEIITDNMKTVMDEARTKNSDGKVNARFQQFAKDYGFKVSPCVGSRPKTKGKVETQMKILERIRAYNGKLNYGELVEFVNKLNNIDNSNYHKGFGRIPIEYLEKEKASLNPLPKDNIRKPYKILSNVVKINNSSMFTFKGNSYSVPPEYLNKQITIQAYDNHLYAYYNTKQIAVHTISNNKLNYQKSHYISILEASRSVKKDKIIETARNNLKILGEAYEYK